MTRKLGGRLAGWTALATAVAVLVCALVGAALVWSREQDERAREGSDIDPVTDETATDEGVDTALAVLLAAVPVIGLTALISRRLARRITDRIDGVVEAATRMTDEQLDERLPVSDAQDELDELARALNALFARLEQGLAAQKQFVSDASHELRTPLAVLRSELEIARRRPRSADEWEAVADRARDEVARMTAMVEALLRLARAGAAPPPADRVDTRALIDASGNRWRGAADAAHVSLELAAADELALTGDAEALAVALGNLVGNAIAHSPEGGRVSLAARRSGDAVEVAVADQGPGVPTADRERIFLPFARGATAADRQATDGGVGLGLSVARRIVEAHRGTIAVDDAPGGGARFVVTLPAR